MRFIAGPRSLLEVEVHVVNNHEILITVPVEVEEGAAGAPPGFWLDEPSLPRLVAKNAVPLCDKKIRIAVVVDIADADPLAPTRVSQPGLVCYVFKL